MVPGRIFTDKVLNSWMLTALICILILPIIIAIGLYLKSLPLLKLESLYELIFSREWSPLNGQFGFWPFITSSLYVTVISFLLAAPLSLLSAIYLTQFASKRWIKIMQPVTDILAGLPSVIYGVWGILIIIPFISKTIAPVFNINTSGYSILAGGIVLAVMCIPYMLNMLIEVLQTVPTGLKEAALSMGATLWQTIKYVIIRKSGPGILSAFGLGIAKAFGETLAVMMVVGNFVQITANPFDAGYPLPALIANNYGEMLSIPKYDSALMFAAFLLLTIILIFNLFFRYFIYNAKRI